MFLTRSPGSALNDDIRRVGNVFTKTTVFSLTFNFYINVYLMHVSLCSIHMLTIMHTVPAQQYNCAIVFNMNRRTKLLPDHSALVTLPSCSELACSFTWLTSVLILQFIICARNMASIWHQGFATRCLHL